MWSQNAESFEGMLMAPGICPAPYSDAVRVSIIITVAVSSPINSYACEGDSVPPEHGLSSAGAGGCGDSSGTVAGKVVKSVGEVDSEGNVGSGHAVEAGSGRLHPVTATSVARHTDIAINPVVVSFIVALNCAKRSTTLRGEARIHMMGVDLPLDGGLEVSVTGTEGISVGGANAHTHVMAQQRVSLPEGFCATRVDESAWRRG